MELFDQRFWSMEVNPGAHEPAYPCFYYKSVIIN